MGTLPFGLTIIIFVPPDASLILIADVGTGAPSHIYLTDDMPSIDVPPLPYAVSGFMENQVMKLGPTSMMSCKEASQQCWSLNLGDDAWVPSVNMLLRHKWNECHMDFGSDIMLFGGGGQ